jgi:hypothetical protein
MEKIPNPVPKSISITSGAVVVVPTSTLQAPIGVYYYPDPGATLTLESTADTEPSSGSWAPESTFTAAGSGHLVARAQFLRVSAAGGAGRVVFMGAL